MKRHLFFLFNKITQSYLFTESILIVEILKLIALEVKLVMKLFGISMLIPNRGQRQNTLYLINSSVNSRMKKPLKIYGTSIALPQLTSTNISSFSLGVL